MNQTNSPANDNTVLLDLYRLMSMTRAIDEVVGKEDGHWHGLEGEEAVVAGTYYGLRDGDVVAPHYRGSLTAALARGADLRTLFAGVLGKATSYNRGRYRSDVCGPPQFGLIGLYSGALGPPLSYATGAALAFKLDKRDNVALAVFGDGTSSRGDCHESMNLASTLKLPVVFVCQNNQVAISTSAHDRVGGRSLVDRAAGYGMPGVDVDGNDVVAVHDAVRTAVGRARRGGGPTLIHALTYRVAGHFISDHADPRPPAEVAAWRQRDPIRAFRRWLVERDVTDEIVLDRISAETSRQAAAAMEQAKKDPDPDEDAFGAQSVYA